MAKKSKKSSKWSYLRRKQAAAAIKARWNKQGIIDNCCYAVAICINTTLINKIKEQVL